MTMDQRKSTAAPRMNLVIHHAAKLCRLGEHTTKRLKGRRNRPLRIKLREDTAKHPATVVKSSRHPLSPKLKNRERSSTCPIHPKGITRLHVWVVQPRQLRLHGLLLIARPPS